MENNNLKENIKAPVVDDINSSQINKKHISIIGSCVSRNLFNTVILSKEFIVDCYAFQRVVWDLLNDSFALPDDLFDKLPVENFTARMLKYSMNKAILNDLKAAKSEYLMIDLHNFFAKLYKLSYKDKFCYFQNISNNDKRALDALNIAPFNEMVLEEVAEVNEQEICTGLEKFAKWVKQNYEETKVIIYISKAAKKAYHNNTIRDYFSNKVNDDAYYDAIVEKYSLVLHDFMPNSKLLFDVGNKTATFGLTDDISVLHTPPSEHYSLSDHIEQSKALLKLLNIKLSTDNPYYDELLRSQNELVLTNFHLMQNKKLILNLNDYVNKIDNMNQVIILISAKDESSQMLKYFRNKNVIGVNAKLKFRDSYIAIVDRLRNFVYEQASQDRLDYDYFVEGKTINITSAGFNSGNISSIKIDDGNELSKSKRGLNIVLLNSKTLKVIDSAYCDTFADKDLKVISDYFTNMKIKAD